MLSILCCLHRTNMIYNFERRCKENVSDNRNKYPNKSNFANHIFKNNHHPALDSKIYPLHFCDHSYKLHYITGNQKT